MALTFRVFILVIAVVKALVLQKPHLRRKILLRANEEDALRESVAVLTERLTVVEAEVAALKEARIAALEKELETLRRPQLSVRGSAVRSAFAARSEFRPFDPNKFEIKDGSKNDEFLDDTLDELLEIGGDPTFLSVAEDSKKEKKIDPAFDKSETKQKNKFVWDGVIDETAYFDDDF